MDTFLAPIEKPRGLIMKLVCRVELTTVWNGAAKRSRKTVNRTIGSR